MESTKLGKKIQDWAASLGFTLPDGSAPPTNHFALLTATPHRRQLWEALIESVQPRQKIERMRKQILAVKFHERRKYPTANSLKQITDRIDLWQKQNEIEADVKEKMNAIIKLEKSIIAKASDSVFEICKLSELEKFLEEVGEKSVVLKLLITRRKKMMDALERKLAKVKDSLSDGSGVVKEESDCVENNLFNVEECKSVLDDDHRCKVLHKMEDLCESGMSEPQIWQKIIKSKGVALDKFSEYLEAVDSNASVLREKESELERKLNLSMVQLKQKMTEKSIQTVINSTNGKLLDAELEEIERRLFEELSGMSHEGSLNENVSFLAPDAADEPTKEEGENLLRNLKNYLNLKEVECYEEFLGEEINRLDEENMKKTKWTSTANGDEENRNILKAFESVVEEINSYKSEDEKLEKEIFDRCGKLQTLLRVLGEEADANSKTGSVEDAGEKLKSASEKQVDLILDTQLDVFRTIETSSRISFECESASHFLNNYGGESKQLFSAMLIPPAGDLRDILTEVDRRKKILNEMKKIVAEREKLAELQRKIQCEMSCINYETRSCEKNFKDSDGILWNVASKTDQILRDVEFIEKILTNWVEQPYRLMVKETTWGKALKEAEEKHKKGKTE